jgi:hypothetical protein
MVSIHKGEKIDRRRNQVSKLKWEELGQRRRVVLIGLA